VGSLAVAGRSPAASETVGLAPFTARRRSLAAGGDASDVAVAERVAAVVVWSVQSFAAAGAFVLLYGLFVGIPGIDHLSVVVNNTHGIKSGSGGRSTNVSPVGRTRR